MNPPSLVGTKIFYLQFHSLIQIYDFKLTWQWYTMILLGQTDMYIQNWYPNVSKSSPFLSSRCDEMSDKDKVIFILHVCTLSLLFWLHSTQTEYSWTATVIDPSCILLAYLAKACQKTRYHIWLNSKSHNCVEVTRMQLDFNGLIRHMVHAASHCFNTLLSLICPVSRMWFATAELFK